NGDIGRDCQLPWHLPEDLNHVARVTAGATGVMGRRTWGSLLDRPRPLPGRRNIVVTRDRSSSSTGAEPAFAVDAALTAAGAADVWIIGGAEIYQRTFNRADRLEVTLVLGQFTGDTYAPDIRSGWAVAEAGETLTSKSGVRYRHISY